MIMEEYSYTREDAKRSVGKGWHALVDKVYDRKPEETIIGQVKEKFGGLRIYAYNHPDEFLDFLIEIENESLRICEVCGEPGEPRGGGWIKTLCDTHNSDRITYYDR